MFRFLKNKKTDIFFILFFIITFILATKLMPHLAISFSSVAGITVKADLLLCSVISMGLLGGRKKAAYFGLITGFVFDVFIGNPYAFSPLVFLICAYFAGPCCKPFSHRTPLSAMLVAAMLVWIKSLFSFFYLIAVTKDAGLFSLLLLGVLPEYIANVISTAVIFAVMRILMAVFRIPTVEAGR